MLPDGRVVRLVYAGRNGQPYTSIGKVIVSEGHDAARDDDAGAPEGLAARQPGAGPPHHAAQPVLHLFLRSATDIDPADGPIGAASVPLTPLRSIAVDRTLWPYGLPFWIAADLPDGDGRDGRRRAPA